MITKRRLQPGSAPGLRRHPMSPSSTLGPTAGYLFLLNTGPRPPQTDVLIENGTCSNSVKVLFSATGQILAIHNLALLSLMSINTHTNQLSPMPSDFAVVQSRRFHSENSKP